jgi:hypothetical protein
MTANDLLTAGFADEWLRALLARLDRLVPPAPTAANMVLYSVPRLALVLDVHVETVRLWLNKGKRGRQS